MHVVLVRVAPVAAIVMTVLSAYGLLWLLGFAHAVRLSPLRITDRGLVIEHGMSTHAVVPAHAIVHATPVAAKADDAVDLSYDEPNVLVELSEPVSVSTIATRFSRG